MLIAQKKRKENIAEYILYMWQLEDLLRANNLDFEKIEQGLLNQFQTSEEQKREIRDWYKGLIDMMKEERIKESGHLQVVTNIVNDLYDLHLRLIKSPEELKYIDKYNRAKPLIDELVQKTKGDVSHEIEACFNGLYGLLLLRLKGHKISESTQQAMQQISELIALLSKRYHEVERGELEI